MAFAESSHELLDGINLDLGSCSSEGIKLFYVVYDYRPKYPSEYPDIVTCFALNKATGDATELAISPASDTEHPKALLLNHTAVAVGSTIYMIGGFLLPGFWPDELQDMSGPLAEVRFFDILRPRDGWREAPPMNIGRMKPTAVVVDGIIYVFGGTEEPFEYGECFDPKTNKWERFPAVGCEPSFACIQVPYVDSNGEKGILVHSDYEENLFSYTLVGSQKWEVVSQYFGKCNRPSAAIRDGIIYAVLEDEEQPLHVYHMMFKKWFPVELPAGIKICSEKAWVFPSGSDKLCLVWFDFDFEDDRVECVELRLNKSYTSTEALNLTASKVSRTYFRMPMNNDRISILAF